VLLNDRKNLGTFVDDRREELLYRKVNQLAALLIAGVSILALLVGVVAILLHGSVKNVDSSLADANRKIAELQTRLELLEQAESASLEQPKPSDATAPSRPASLQRNRRSPKRPATMPTDGSAASVPQESSGVLALRRGIEALESGRNTQALAALTEAKKDKAVAGQAAVLLAQMAFEAGDLVTAVAELDDCDSVDPGNVDAPRVRARIAFAKQQFEECATIIAAMPAGNAENVALLMMLGESQLQLNRFSEAADAFGQVTDVDPQNDKAWHFGGVALLKNLDPAQAADRFARAIEFAPQEVETWLHLGVALTNSDDCPAAVDAFAQALALDETSADAHWGRAVALARMGKGAEARSALARAVELAPGLAGLASAVPGLLEVEHQRARKKTGRRQR